MFRFESLSPSDFPVFLSILVIAIAVLVVTRKLLHVSFPYFFMGLIGLIVGLLVGSLVSTPLSGLPGAFGKWLPIIVNVFVTVSVLDLFINQAHPITIVLGKLFNRISEFSIDSNEVIIDTSVLVDGRVEEIWTTGFITCNMIVPDFVISELQKLADSRHPTTRAKGRRGLEVVKNLQKNAKRSFEIIDVDTTEKKKNQEVDDRLLKLAKIRHAKLMTVDYNLAHVAQIKHIDVLNINELAQSLKPLLLPGEELSVKVIQEGKEKGQGVGYLDDGTMIVVEGGDKLVGREVNCQVVRVYQTIAGKMIFVEPKDN